ncbi:class I SAM-dependent methyltransferase [Hydrogenophaga sp. UC242_50]|jgi:SAM-dependent methyltransferase|uniref:class I SAM-dependent methyltransferase n=1 Tax=unclassified Hydrogenophaga TaxID=2610897 RepID=UPI0036D3C5D8
MPNVPSPWHFDELFRQNDDPWGFRSRWYEARKRALTVACLPTRRYTSGYEPGCANGELSAQLAERCERLRVSDVSARAVELARARLAAFPHVEVVRAHLPADWPVGRFDLIAISELGYFVDVASLDAIAGQARESLLPGGTVLACHWRRPIDGCALDGEAVHKRLARGLGLPTLCEVREADFVLHVWSSDPRSVAEREGFDW